MNFTKQQWLMIAIGITTAATGLTSQFDTLFGTTVEHDIIAVAAIAGTMLSVVGAVVTGQPSQVQTVKSMPGVSKIFVNEQASPALAALAAGPDPKVVPEPGKEQAVATIADAAQ